MPHRNLRLVLVALDGLLAVTAIVAAIAVVPHLPQEWLKRGIFPDYTIPALALGVLVGGSALIATLVAGFWARAGAVVTVVAAAMVLWFEIIEIATCGVAVIEWGPGYAAGWLQVFYIVLGLVLAVLGTRLWLIEGGRIPIIGPKPAAPAR